MALQEIDREYGGGVERQFREALEAIQGEAYLWQIDDSPFGWSEAVIEEMRLIARRALDAAEGGER